MTYTVKYRSPKGHFWRTIKEVEGDTCFEHQIALPDGKFKITPLPVRVLYLKNKSRIEIPMSFLIKFSKERFISIQEAMSRQVGQKIQTF